MQKKLKNYDAATKFDVVKIAPLHLRLGRKNKTLFQNSSHWQVKFPGRHKAFFLFKEQGKVWLCCVK